MIVLCLFVQVVIISRPLGIEVSRQRQYHESVAPRCEYRSSTSRSILTTYTIKVPLPSPSTIKSDWSMLKSQ